MFCHIDGQPLTRYQFQAVLRKALQQCGIKADSFGTHSFRIGAATTAALNGVPAEEIKKMGRWRSNAFQSYIRV